MYELRMLYMRGPGDEERVAFTEDLEADANDWCMSGWRRSSSTP